MKVVVTILALAFAVGAYADESGAGAPPDHAKFKAAMESCRESAKSETDKEKRHAAWESCMTAAGFPKPKGHHHHGPPPADAPPAAAE